MKVDRDLQQEILRRLNNVYPEWEHPASVVDEPHVIANLCYLRDHGLIEARLERLVGPDKLWSFAGAKITVKGIDFIAADGGLSAILDVTTVRIHDDTIKDLIEARITSSSLEPADKQRYLDRLRSLPADATRQAVLELTKKGVDSLPSVFQWLDTFFRASQQAV